MGALAKISSKGQIVIPKVLRVELNLHEGDEVSFDIINDGLYIKKLPTSLEWSNLISDIPTEVVDFDDNGNYDKERSPNFHDWMVNG